MQRKALDSVEKHWPASVKVPKLGVSSSSPYTYVRMPKQARSPLAEVPKVLSLQPRSGSVEKGKGSSGRAVEQPLAVMPSLSGTCLRRVLGHLLRGRKS